MPLGVLSPGALIARAGGAPGLEADPLRGALGGRGRLLSPCGLTCCVSRGVLARAVRAARGSGRLLLDALQAGGERTGQNQVARARRAHRLLLLLLAALVPPVPAHAAEDPFQPPLLFAASLARLGMVSLAGLRSPVLFQQGEEAVGLGHRAAGQGAQARPGGFGGSGDRPGPAVIAPARRLLLLAALQHQHLG
nr:unnamed protein product [Mus musculus]